MKSAAHIVSILVFIIMPVSCSYMQRTDTGFKHTEKISGLAENTTMTILIRPARDEFIFLEYYYEMTDLVRQCAFDAFRISDAVIIFDSYLAQVPKDTYKTDYSVELRFDEENDFGDFLDWISLCTLMVIPSTGKTTLTMEALVHIKDGGRDYHFSRKAEFKTWYHLSFMIIQPFVDGYEQLLYAAKSDMIMDVFLAMNRDGLLK